MRTNLSYTRATSPAGRTCLVLSLAVDYYFSSGLFGNYKKITTLFDFVLENDSFAIFYHVNFLFFISNFDDFSK